MEKVKRIAELISGLPADDQNFILGYIMAGQSAIALLAESDLKSFTKPHKALAQELIKAAADGSDNG